MEVPLLFAGVEIPRQASAGEPNPTGERVGAVTVDIVPRVVVGARQLGEQVGPGLQEWLRRRAGRVNDTCLGVGVSRAVVRRTRLRVVAVDDLADAIPLCAGCRGEGVGDESEVRSVESGLECAVVCGGVVAGDAGRGLSEQEIPKSVAGARSVGG